MSLHPPCDLVIAIQSACIFVCTKHDSMHQEPFKDENVMEVGVLETLVHLAYLKQATQVQPDMIGKAQVLFRNQWPPNFSPPTDKSSIYIHQQAFEFIGIPQSWIFPMNNVIDEIWVPSESNADAFVASGVLAGKVKVLKHGIDAWKYNMTVLPYPLPTIKTFRFLFNGGLLPRKGIDLLLTAYSRAFTYNDDVSLIIHSSYGDDYVLANITELANDPQSPEILLLQEDLSEQDMQKLYLAASAYVAPYRSEGFGLTILEAMAAGLQVITTDFGPSKEICPSSPPEACLKVDAHAANCYIVPCGNMTLFGEPASLQPRWSELNLESLQARMVEMYKNRSSKSADLPKKIRAYASQQTWFNVGTIMFEKIKLLLDSKQLRT
jgi:glycosyltransferase involved in cell wall biosynthesis